VIKVKTEHLSQKLLLLKKLDETIDFSKSTLQIEVMFTFLMGKEKLTPSELVEVLDERRKAVLDALRKMQLKGIIKKEGEVEGEPVYVLTESGLRYSKKLKEALGLSTHDNSVQINEEYISNREK
jgi:predicted transcriptional regulator